MSLAHIRFIQEKDSNIAAEYRVETPDMTDKPNWEEVGRICLKKDTKEYTFFPGALWVEKQALPPSLYGLSEPEQKKLLNSDYDGFGWGTWSMIIHHYAASLLEHQSYPMRYPETMFIGKEAE